MEIDLKTHKTCKNTLNNHRGFSNLFLQHRTEWLLMFVKVIIGRLRSAYSS